MSKNRATLNINDVAPRVRDLAHQIAEFAVDHMANDGITKSMALVRALVAYAVYIEKVRIAVDEDDGNTPGPRLRGDRGGLGEER